MKAIAQVILYHTTYYLCVCGRDLAVDYVVYVEDMTNRSYEKFLKDKEGLAVRTLVHRLDN